MDIHQSIDQILDSDSTWGESFYEIFLSRYPEVRKYFQRVDLQRQAVLLTMAMLIVEQYETNSYPMMAKYLAELGAKHREWGIPQDLYPYFRAALLEALQRFHGTEWSERLSRQWATAIDRTTTQMLKGYDRTSERAKCD